MLKFKLTTLVVASLIAAVSIFSSLKSFAVEYAGVKTTVGPLTSCHCQDSTNTCSCNF